MAEAIARIECRTAEHKKCCFFVFGSRLQEVLINLTNDGGLRSQDEFTGEVVFHPAASVTKVQQGLTGSHG